MVVGTDQNAVGGEAVPDILSQGGGRERGPWPRRVVAAAVLVLAAVVIVQHLPRSRHGAARQARAAATVTAPVAASGTAEPAVGLAAIPDGITGQAGSWPSGLRLPAAGQRPAWFWPATGQVVPIGGLPPQRSGYQFIRAAGGWAVQAGPGVRAGCGSCAGPQRAVYFLADHAQSVTQVGLADAVAPGPAGALWLTSYPPGADPGTAAGTAREVSITGATARAAAQASGRVPDRAGDRPRPAAGPVTPRPGTMAYQLRDPAAPQASRTFEAVIAASATQIAWAPPCTARCRVLTLNLVTGRQVTAELPEGRSVANAAFSPDSSSLALEVSFSNEADDGGQAVQLELRVHGQRPPDGRAGDLAQQRCPDQLRLARQQRQPGRRAGLHDQGPARVVAPRRQPAGHRGAQATAKPRPLVIGPYAP